MLNAYLNPSFRGIWKEGLDMYDALSYVPAQSASTREGMELDRLVTGALSVLFYVGTAWGSAVVAVPQVPTAISYAVENSATMASVAFSSLSWPVEDGTVVSQRQFSSVSGVRRQKIVGKSIGKYAPRIDITPLEPEIITPIAGLEVFPLRAIKVVSKNSGKYSPRIGIPEGGQ